MTKLYFRSKALDVHKALPIYLSSDILDLSECSTNNRDVPVMPTGMEKEEENEKHFQLAQDAQRNVANLLNVICKANVIPIPKVEVLPLKDTECKILNNDLVYFKINLFEDLSNETLPDYDLDSEDEEWLNDNLQLSISHQNFEHIISTFPNMNYFDRVSIRLNLSRTGLEVTNLFLEQIYEHWMRKQIHHVNSSEITLIETPYSAFRKRNDRIITRRYRKFDKQNYERLDQFKNSFGIFYRITELIYSREVLKNKLILLLQATFFQRNDDQSWIGVCNIEFHTDTYFITTIPSYEHDRRIETHQICAIDNIQLIHSLDIISNNKSKYTEEWIPEECLPVSASMFYQNSKDPSHLSKIDGRFSFFPNTISRYIHPSTNSSLLTQRISSKSDHFNKSINKVDSSGYRVCTRYPSRISILRPVKKSIGMILTSSETDFHSSNTIFQLDSCM